ncbi:apo-citrate lyase phosphoribosyl-dephospho-CoA transferase [Thermococcus sp. M39]|uniref:triphosphoribosyl-dephospho-CoA synthase n=1 Tax=Thermococcus sp. M39 TaxID=1638262 RepID=UPI00143B415F|nr:triphosphoribosyl-dephospho-CoA synthase [Thermococcus sp. M39]NJE07874.1 apo-citrate lyase phosphoribosyl-dephospho-CoA transferase [Thermococcus sp. M39]
MERWKIIKAFTLGPLLEATIPKPGNVNRFKDFEDLTLYHFLFGNVAVVDILYEATEVGKLIRRGYYQLSEANIGEMIKRAVQNAKAVQDANPNFGIIALEIPLVIALVISRHIYDAREVVKRLIAHSTVRDTMEFYKAIRVANPKGIKSGVKYDVYDENVFDELFKDRINLKRLAEISCERELIFCEWINGYELSYKTFLRLKELTEEFNLEEAVLKAFIELLASTPDTLIIRKAGKAEAELVMRTAKEVLDGNLSIDELDKLLREKGDLRNPGSLADIMAIALSLLILDGYKLNL